MIGHSLKNYFLIILTSIFCAFQNMVANAQSLANYTFSTTTSTFSLLSSASVPTLTGTINQGAYNNLPIGFDFWYMGERYTSVSASTNGFLTLGTTVSSSDNYGATNNLSTGAHRPVLAPLWDDLAMSTTGKVTYRTTGTVGNRLFVVQYLNVRWNSGASTSSGNATISFQVRIEEATNSITFNYRTESGAVSSTSAHIGISSTNTGSNNYISVGGTVSSPTSSRTSLTSITAKPTNNRIFTFTPSSPISPSNLTYSEIDTNLVTLNWIDNSSDEAGFAIYYSTNGSDFTYLNSTGPNVSTYTATGLVKGQNYYWRVHAIREVLSSAVQGEQGTRGDIPTDFGANFPFSGNAVDVSGNGFNGTVQNGATLVDDRFGIPNSAYSFDGSTQYISTAKLMAAPGPNVFSFSVWIKTTTTSGGKIFGYGGASVGQSSSYDRHLYMTNSGQLVFGVYANNTVETIATPGTFNDGNWHNVICILGPNGQKLYVNGILQGTKPAVTTAENIPGYWKVGFDNLNGWTDMPSSFYFQGVIDDISVYNRELNSSEIFSFSYIPTDTYAYWKNITLNTSNIVSGTLTNFPYLLNLTDPDLILNSSSCDVSTEGINVGKVLSSTGADISFALLTGERLNYEIIKYNPTIGELWAWVKLPSVSSTSNLSIKMLFGNPSPTPNVSSQTWGDYRAVFHFDENTYSGTTVDATALSLVGTNTSMNSSNLVAGKILNAYSFNGSNQKIAVQANAATNVTGNLTLSAWVNSPNPGVDQKIISNQNSSIQGYKMGLFGSKPENQNDGNPNRDGSGATGTSQVLAANTWYHIMGVYQGTTLRMYVNGVLRQSRTGVSSASAGMNLNFGVGEGGNQYYFNGTIDEPRVSNVARSAEWALSEYRNQNNPTISGTLPSILSIGSLQADPVLASAYPGLYFNFTGAINNNFNGNGNYSSNATNLNTLPANLSLVSVIIPTGKTPVMSSNANLNAIALRSGATLGLNGFNLSIACNVYNNGVINGSGGKLIFNGAVANQEYFGSSSIVTSSVGDLEVSNSVGGTLTINSGLLDVYTGVNISNASKLNILNAATLTLKSNATTFANVSPLVSPSIITGNVVVESYFTGGVGKRGTRMVSSAINESTMRAAGRSIYQQFREHMVITGPQDGGFDPGNHARPYAITLTKYNEPALFSQTSLQFLPISNIITGTVPNELPGSAFFLFYRGNRDNYTVLDGSTSTKLYDDYIPESFSASLTGPLNQGQITIPITHSNNAGDANNGFNVVGNPYAATIDWEKVYASNSTLVENQIRIIQPGGAIMTRTKSGSNPAVVINAIGNAANAQFIQPGQGFYIKKSNAGTSNLVFTESHKAVTATPNRLLSAPIDKKFNTYMSTEAPAYEKQPVVLFLNMVNASNTNRDETALVFKTGLTESLDTDDALYITNNTVILGSVSADGYNLAINYLPELSEQLNVKLLTNAAVSGSYSLNFTNLLSLGRYKAKLKDKYLNKEMDLSLNPNYAFDIDRTVGASFGNNRFEVSFVEGPPLTFDLKSFEATQAEEKVKINFTTGSEITAEKVEIETSMSGSSFIKVGEVKSSGTSNSASDYEFMHVDPVQGDNYYRLKQIYADGTYTYSNTIFTTYRLLEFQNLEVTRQKQSLQLKWSSNSEYNTVNFQVERSVNDGTFVNIGQVIAKGSATGISNYAFEDASPAEGVLRYRLIAQFSDAIPTISPILNYNYRSSYLFDFKLAKSALTTVLSWKPLDPYISVLYTVERSADGENFSNQISIPSTAINEVGIIEFTDGKPLDGINYYRIKQKVGEEDVLYSAVKSIDFRVLNLKSFKLTQIDSRISIVWSIDSDVRHSNFEIQKSLDGITFETFTTVPISTLNNGIVEYQGFDSKPGDGLIYYRLKLNYKDGGLSYSDAADINLLSSGIAKLHLSQTDEGVMLKWEAINEGEKSIFYIQRSSNGIDFTKIGSVSAIELEGLNNYQFEDVGPEYKVLHYKIEESFPQGSVTSSSVEKINHILRSVKLKDFDVYQSALGAGINWETENENSVAKIVIEKSLDGVAFSAIEEFANKGTDLIGARYSHVDQAAAIGLNYYRLKYLFVDNTFKYSPVLEFNAVSFKLDAFEIVKVPNRVKLSWTGLNEVNALQYIIERATDGRNFIKVAELAVKGGERANTYVYFDDNATKGINYYRLVLKYADETSRQLPIEAFEFLKFEGYLTLFTAVKQGFKTILNWKTIDDTLIKQFEIEKSVDGTLYERISTLPVMGHAKSGDVYNFDYGVNSPLNKAVYYRIKLISLENEIDYSAVQSVFNSETQEVVNESVLIYPNPAQEYIEIASQEVNVVVNLLNVAGKVVKSVSFSKNTAIRMDVSNFITGIYYMDIRQNDSKGRIIGRGKFIKN